MRPHNAANCAAIGRAMPGATRVSPPFSNSVSNTHARLLRPRPALTECTPLTRGGPDPNPRTSLSLPVGRERAKEALIACCSAASRKKSQSSAC